MVLKRSFLKIKELNLIESMKSESMCRMIFQHFVQQRFVKCRPSFLGTFELDGYCKKHELAFEYNGIQHYQYVPYFHSSYSKFERQQENDQRKRDLCLRHGLILITIPPIYTIHTMPATTYFIHDQLLRAERTRSDVYMVNRCPRTALVNFAYNSPNSTF